MNEQSKKIAEVYENKEYYDYMGGGFLKYADGLSNKFKKAIKLAERNTSKLIRVLDVGCGRGELVNYFSKRNISSIGIEYSALAANMAKEYLKNNDRKYWEIMNIKNDTLDFPENSFDVVFMLDVVEHLYNEQLGKYYKQILRVLKPGGVFIIHTWPNRMQKENKIASNYEILMRNLLALPYRILFGKELKTESRDKCERLVHVNEQTPGQIEKDLLSTGFNKVRLETGYFAGDRPDHFSEFFGETVINMFIIGLIPGLKKYLNRYIWTVAQK